MKPALLVLAALYLARAAYVRAARRADRARTGRRPDFDAEVWG